MIYEKDWSQKDSPLIWVEMIFIGDTYKMPELLGFSYGGHCFKSVGQETTFLRNIKTRKKANAYGARKLSDPNFLRHYLERSIKSESSLREQISGIQNALSSRIRQFEFKYVQNTWIESRLLGFKPSFTLSSNPTITDKVALRGTGTFIGTAEGRVRIIDISLSGADLSLVKKGDIIVTVMTSPDMIPALGKASGIVTDEGGLLCHAAVISREMKIPCVIGTQNATETLKNGDVVRIDGSKGTVEVMKKAL